MALDPLLDAHCVASGFYVISAGPTPISIRDQMLRGRSIVQRLFEQGLIHEHAPLIVVGAGAGGATAAVWAADDERRVPTLLIEKDAGPFGLQKRADTRHIDPTQYDWPVDHWHHGVFPWSNNLRLSDGMPLPYSTKTGRELALDWTDRLREHEARLAPRLKIYFETEASDVQPGAAPSNWKVVFDGKHAGDATGVVVWAAGPPTEECRLFRDPPGTPNRVPKYEGYPFWSHDPFCSDRCGIGRIKSPRVLICGSGDGGLQDYLRVVTRRQLAVDVLRDCNIPAEITSRIQSAEDRAHRGRVWACDDVAWRSIHERPYLLELDEVHRGCVADALGDDDVKDGLQSLFQGISIPLVALVYREKVFTNYYGLNRFLVHLISSFIRQETSVETVFPETEIVDINPSAHDPHTCIVRNAISNDWEANISPAGRECHGKDHTVVFRSSDGQEVEDSFNIIVVRYGARDRSQNLPPIPEEYIVGPLLKRPRHLLPYHMPSSGP